MNNLIPGWCVKCGVAIADTVQSTHCSKCTEAGSLIMVDGYGYALYRTTEIKRKRFVPTTLTKPAFMCAHDKAFGDCDSCHGGF